MKCPKYQNPMIDLLFKNCKSPDSFFEPGLLSCSFGDCTIVQKDFSVAEFSAVHPVAIKNKFATV